MNADAGPLRGVVRDVQADRREIRPPIRTGQHGICREDSPGLRVRRFGFDALPRGDRMWECLEVHLAGGTGRRARPHHDTCTEDQQHDQRGALPAHACTADG